MSEADKVAAEIAAQMDQLERSMRAFAQWHNIPWPPIEESERPTSGGMKRPNTRRPPVK